MASSRKRRNARSASGRVPTRSLPKSARKRDTKFRQAVGAGTADLVSEVAARLAGVIRPGDRLVAALSGGIDSVVLLDILHRLRRRVGASLSAVHVNHKLSRNASRWSAFCRRICRARGIPFRSMSVTVTRGDSLEARARAARYEVFARLPCDYVVLGQHQDDQVETLLLQLLRGSGVKGLAAMPFLRAEGGGRRAEGSSVGSLERDSSSQPAALHRVGRSPARTCAGTSIEIPDSLPHPSSRGRSPAILRPLLEITRAEIERYARARGLRWVEDETNTDLHFQRNFLRHEVLPIIGTRFPAYRATVARAVRHLAECAGLLDELAASDGAGAFDGTTLATAALKRLAPARARNLLRYFMAVRGASMPNAVRLDEALRQALTAKHDAQVLVDLGGFELRRFEDRLYVVQKRPAPSGSHARRWLGQRAIALPEFGGVLVMVRSRGEGLSLERLQQHPVSISPRRGGERLRPDARRPRRTLKNLMQEARIPPWERERLPLICCGRDLVWAPVIGPDCAYRAAPGERAVSPVWRPTGDAGTR